eukprot:g182.t1
MLGAWQRSWPSTAWSTWVSWPLRRPPAVSRAGGHHPSRAAACARRSSTRRPPGQLQRAAAGTDLDAPVALSRCAGFRSQHRRQRRNHTRGVALSFLDEAVELLRPYRFALVFENKLVPGYVTEKIVNAFLAGCIPIYWGSRAVLEIFNPESFIYANDIQAPGFSDEQLFDPLMHLERVLRIAQDPVALEGMANTPALDAKRLQRFFSWHRGVRRHLAALPVPDAADEAVPQRLARALPRLQRRRRCAGGRRGTCVEDVDEPVM